MTDTPNDWTDNDLEQLSRIAPILDAECKAAAAAALEQANKEFWRVWHKQSVGTPIAVAVTHSIEAATSGLSPDSHYIALREANARIAELQDQVKRFTDLRRQERIRVAGRHSDRFAASDIAESEVSQFHSPITDTLTNVVTLLGLDIAALTEARDRLAKK